MVYDLVIKGGERFIPKDKEFSKADIGVKNGRILKIQPSLVQNEAERVIDASGMIISPGLIDFHVHCFFLVHKISIDPDRLAPRAGTTTMVDAGSAGALNFDAFREFIIKKSNVNILAFLNISLLGQCFEAQISGVPIIHEYDDLRLVHIDQTVKCIDENRDFLVGVKVRAYHGLTNLTPIYSAIEAAEQTDVPLMIHTAAPPPSTRQYMHLLRPGDIVTHLYHPEPRSIVDGKGRIRPEYREARERGVLMETGFARWHTDFEVMKSAVQQGFWPDIISTDVTATNVEDLVYDVLYTASKFLAVGMPIEEVLAAMTIAPAKAMRQNQLVELEEGSIADLTVIQRIEEDTIFYDYYGHSLKGKERIECKWLIRKGEVIRNENLKIN
jgi:dihydroorotase